MAKLSVLLAFSVFVWSLRVVWDLARDTIRELRGKDNDDE